MTEHKTINLATDMYEYLLSVSLRESEVLRDLRDETAQQTLARMQIAPDQGQLLSMLVRLSGAQRALEIGVFTGYSSICIAQALPDEGQLIACDINAEWTDIARKYWSQAGLGDRIELRLAPAMQSLKHLLDMGEQSSFDFAFIDADKENYLGYYEACLQLVRPGGLICIDNVLWSGKVLESDTSDEETRAIQQLNQHVHTDERVDVVMLAVADGITLALKK